ncbi:MAG: S8 family serine peptidase [Synergistaceae bacterium]|nr:S8 family serine peptidase [Synergistaceae bacterium]
MSSCRKIFLALFTLIFISLSSCSFAYDYVKGDVVVVLRNADSNSRLTASSFSENGAGISAASSFAKSSGAVLTRTYPALSQAGNNIFALIHSDDIDPEEYAKELLKNPNVIAASPNYKVRAAVVPNDTYMSQLWGMTKINMPSAWDKETGSSTVYVAIIDSGIDWTNPDLAANTARDLGFTANGISSSQPGFDNYGHGTHVAGTIGAVSNNSAGVAGINWYVRMIPVKVLDSNGGGTTSTVIEGMDYVASLMSEGYNIRALNLSLEAYIKMTPVHDNLIVYPMWQAFKAIDEYNQAVIVVAAGNQTVKIGEPTTYTKREGGSVIFERGCYAYPSSFKGLNNMISVSAANQSGNVASYSNTNANISAPGGDYYTDRSIIISTWIQSDSGALFDNGISLWGEQGTSMAAPHVAGAAALLAAHDPDMTAYQIKQCILNSAASGAEGMLDVNAALDYQEYYGLSLASEGTESYGYEDWKDEPAPYDPDYDYDYGTDKKSSSGGCNGLTAGIFALIILCPIAKKFMS